MISRILNITKLGNPHQLLYQTPQKPTTYPRPPSPRKPNLHLARSLPAYHRLAHELRVRGRSSVGETSFGDGLARSRGANGRKAALAEWEGGFVIGRRRNEAPRLGRKRGDCCAGGFFSVAGESPEAFLGSVGFLLFFCLCRLLCLSEGMRITGFEAQEMEDEMGAGGVLRGWRRVVVQGRPGRRDHGIGRRATRRSLS